MKQIMVPDPHGFDVVNDLHLSSSKDHLDGILTARGSRYGRFVDNAFIAQKLKAVLREGVRWDQGDSDQREAADNICIKLSRIVTGDPDYADNWDDIAGYAKLVADRIRGDAK